ncbi:TniQ family protein [Paraburkholderia sp. LEh10]|uniref:TnsD family Tn7-like transposition protein n=1 Tax=Paraburkholderia sp. LEh10 TaxID=2821353 RepID=UPI001AE8BF9D|nr:TniQ family protein [Paraburkholderia sp. LEh10]
MTIALPIPYEDELLYSVIARYLDQTFTKSPAFILNQLFGCSSRRSPELICGLGEFARQTDLSWRLSPLEIAQNYTSLPYFSSYANPERIQTAYAAITRGETISGLLKMLCVRNGTVPGPSSLRFCRQCAEQDLADGPESYWRRAHQLPGVFICLKHIEMLCNSRIPTRPLAPNQWITLTQTMKSQAACRSDVVPDWMLRADVLHVMHESVDLLSNELAFLKPMTSTQWSFQAERAGLLHRGGYIDTIGLLSGIEEMYGKEYLKLVGLLRENEYNRVSWSWRTITGRGRSAHPLQHILLRNFLEKRAKTNNPGRRPVWTEFTRNLQVYCPNRYASHGPNHFAERVKEVRRVDGTLSFLASCGCGMRFGYVNCLKGSSLPENPRTVSYGHEWRSTAQQMKRSGMTRKAISLQMNIPLSSVINMVTKQRSCSQKQPTKREIFGWRRQWRELLATTALHRHSLAAKLDGRLYYRLNTYDKKWLKKSGEVCGEAYATSIVDWCDRDRRWSVALRKANKRIRSWDTPLTRASKTRIAAEAGLPRLTEQLYKEELESCRTVLAGLEESVEDFQIRRLEAVAKRPNFGSVRLTRSYLLNCARIRPSRLKPRIEATLARLLQPSSAPHR